MRVGIVVVQVERAAVADALVVFTPSGKRGRFEIGTPLLQAARSLGVDVDSVCGGRAMCTRCQVLVAEGEFAKHGVTSSLEHVSEVTQPEQRLSRRGILKSGFRLSCQAQVLGDVVVDVPASSQVHRQVVRKAAEARDIDLRPAISLHYVEVAEPDMHDPSGDLRRLKNALAREWQLENLDCDATLLSGLQVILRKGAFKVTVAVHAKKTIIAVWPGLQERVYGIAVDVGSTTIAAHMCDLTNGEVLASAGVMNPQIRFGEDLMSRVSYSMMNPNGAVQMTEAVREALSGLAKDVAAQASIELNDILEMTVVGNPIMHHLLLGIDPVELGGAPFALAVDQAMTFTARDLQLSLNPAMRIYTLPCIAGHVGADTAGVVLAERPDLLDPITLLVDVGTNAEIVLGNKHRLLACSSPTGPAFEGAQISGGQRAAPGAIERVRIDPKTLNPKFRVIGSTHWSDEPAFSSSEKPTEVTGICGSGIIEVIAEMYLAGVINQDGVIDGAMAAISDRIRVNGRTYSYVLYEDSERTIVITQNDVRAIQLAKAALHAGVQLLMDRLGVTEVQRVRLAGAFGSHIDVKYAMVLGMIPDCVLNEVTSAGNAAGTGARIALLDQDSRAIIEKIVGQIEKIETAIEPKFQEHFVESMAIPHKRLPYNHLRSAVALPENKAVAVAEGRERKNRRVREA